MQDVEKGQNFALDGLTDAEVTASREQHGENEVKANQEPEWKKILKRYTDWVVVMMVSPNFCTKGSFILILVEVLPSSPCYSTVHIDPLQLLSMFTYSSLVC